MNFFFAVLVFGFIAYTGEETRAARIAEVTIGSKAEKSGLKSQDLILSVNDKTVRSFEEFQNELNEYQGQIIQITVQQENDQPRTLSTEVVSVPNPNLFTLNKTIGSIDGTLPFTKGSLVAVKLDSAAYKLGLRTGDEITKIADKKIQSWNDLNRLLQTNNVDISLERLNVSTQKREVVSLKLEIGDKNIFKSIEEFGLESSELYLEQIVPDSPAAKADLKQYDKLLSINNIPMTKWEDVLNTVKNYNGQDALDFKIQREGVEIVKKITPQMTSQMTFQGKEEKRFTIGILPMANISQPEIVKVREESLFAAINKGVSRSVDISTMTVLSFVRLFQGEVSHKNIGGMISIGKAAKDSFAMGLQSFLYTMGILSISLFILNLLPVPVLDGGHLVFYAIEVVKGSPLSGRKLEIAHQIGFALLMGLMLLSIFNDITKFLFKA